jgi:hypothetical protein
VALQVERRQRLKAKPASSSPSLLPLAPAGNRGRRLADAPGCSVVTTRRSSCSPAESGGCQGWETCGRTGRSPGVRGNGGSAGDRERHGR